MTNKRKQKVVIYKPNKRGTGGAAQFELGRDKDCVFLDIAKQDGDKSFNWGNKIVVKIGIPDMIKMLAYFKMQNPSKPLKLMHKTGDDSKMISLDWQDKYNSYYFSVSAKSDGEINRASLPIGIDEVELLSVAFRRAIEVIIGW